MAFSKMHIVLLLWETDFLIVKEEQWYGIHLGSHQYYMISGKGNTSTDYTIVYGLAVIYKPSITLEAMHASQWFYL